MSDLISRQASIDAVEHITSSMSVCVNKDECHGMKRMQRQAVIELANLPSAQQWIPVSERLPDDLAEVNVTWVNHKPESYYESIKDEPFTATAVFYKGKWYWWTTYTQDLLAEYGERCNVGLMDEAIEVIAWMPLPEPYRKVE